MKFILNIEILFSFYIQLNELNYVELQIVEPNVNRTIIIQGTGER